jgi:hypothetical protein
LENRVTQLEDVIKNTFEGTTNLLAQLSCEINDVKILKDQITKKEVIDLAENETNEQIKQIDNEIVHSISPNSELRSITTKFFDLNKDGKTDIADWKFFFKIIAKWFAIIAGIILALINSKNGGLVIDLMNISGWITIICVGIVQAYSIFSKKKDAAVFLAKILKYRDLILMFIDFINNLINNKEKQDIELMLREFLIKVKDELFRNEAEEKK